MTSRLFAWSAAIVLFVWSAPSVLSASYILDGGFEAQASSQNLPHYALGPNGEKWGSAWGYPPSNFQSSWQGIVSTGSSWVGGQICRSEDFTTGWKHARSGDVFGIIKDRQTMSLTFTAVEDSVATLNWYDAGRNSWRQDTWYGRPNDYNVTITELAGGATQNIASFTSAPVGGTEANSNSNASDARFDLVNRQAWVARSSSSFSLSAGKTYTLSFNSLSPYLYNSSGFVVGVDDRTTLLDDISMTLSAPPAVPEPTTLAILGIGGTGMFLLRRRRR